MQLEKKVAAVTGGTAGIGKAIVEIFLEKNKGFIIDLNKLKTVSGYFGCGFFYLY